MSQCRKCYESNLYKPTPVYYKHKSWSQGSFGLDRFHSTLYIFKEFYVKIKRHKITVWIWVIYIIQCVLLIGHAVIFNTDNTEFNLILIVTWMQFIVYKDNWNEIQ